MKLNLITCEVTLQLFEEQAKILKTWLVNVGGLEHRVVLAKETQVWSLSQSLFLSISESGFLQTHNQDLCLLFSIVS